MQDEEVIYAYARRLFQNVADIQTVVSARDESWKETLWAGIEETGLNLAATPEALGGAGVGLQTALGILRVAGHMAIAAPLAETMMAGWLLGMAGLQAPVGRMAYGPAGFGDRLVSDGKTVSGRVGRLPFARECKHAVLLAEHGSQPWVVLVDLAGATMRPRVNLAFEPADEVALSDHPVLAAAPAPAGLDREAVLLMGSTARAMQMAGALERVLELTTDYVTQRRAFERTISKFQAVQHSVAQLAGEVAVTLSAASSAAEAADALLLQQRGFEDPELRLELMSAKIRAAAAAQKGAAIAHQLHGAIGVTREHILHRLTLRALAWRDDYGNESEWSERLGRYLCGQGAGALWPLLATR